MATVAADREAAARAKLSSVLQETSIFASAAATSSADEVYSRDINIPAINTHLKQTSNLRTSKRDTLADVLERHGSTGEGRGLQFMTHDVLAPRRVDSLTAALEGVAKPELAATAASSPDMTKVYSQTKTQRVLRDTVGVLLSAAGTSEPLSTEYRVASKFTPDMAATVKHRDMTHALKADESRRYQEERVKFDRMLGGPKKSRGEPLKRG